MCGGREKLACEAQHRNDPHDDQQISFHNPLLGEA
jgi:hypothetical protein